ncbi:MAG TPA: hypothetical protein PK264_13255 [Hyphomicrobiaceae bacterium]|nr:hypothetical protein [Hyphomicrobiaceae bacterium]
MRINPKAAADPPPPSAPAKPKVVKAAPPAVDATVKAPPAKTAAASPSGFITRARCVQMIRNKYKFIYAATDWQTKIDLCVTTKGQTF